MAKQRLFEGTVHPSNCFGDFTIIRYGNNRDIDVQFINTGTIVNTNSVNISKGRIRDPYAITVVGVAHLGEYDKPTNAEESKLHKRKYTMWYNMISCCYDENRKGWFPHYRGCSVCDRWLCFAHFLEDLPKLKGFDDWLECTEENKYIISKRSKYIHNRVFSPAACELVPIRHLTAISRVKHLGTSYKKPYKYNI